MSNMQLKSLIYFTSVIAVAFCSTPLDVLDDFAALKTSLTTLDNAFVAFPNSGGSLFEILVGQHKVMVSVLNLFVCT